MIRTDDGMKGEVELVQVPGFETEFEKRVVYIDRGEKRVAGKREGWEPEKAPPRKLTGAEITLIAWAADLELEAIDQNRLAHRWQKPEPGRGAYDIGLCNVIGEYLAKRD
jgi:hypothetical protein